MIVGRVKEIWRYPVKSMGGERLDQCHLGALGLAGDRGFALRDDTAGEIRGAKKLPALLQCQARYAEEPSEAHIPPALITFPDGSPGRSDDAGISKRLSQLVGRPVTLFSRRPADDLAHYRRGLPDQPDMIAELRAIFGRLEDEPLPDLAQLPSELFEYTSPLGTYFDVFPIHLLTTASLSTLATKNPQARFDIRRFRPNLVIEGSAGSGGETDWCGKSLRVGDALLQVTIPTPRCVMITHPQADLPKDPSVLRTVVRDAEQKLGVYAAPQTAGAVRVGDPVALA